MTIADEIAKLVGEPALRTSTHQATVLRTDNDGTTWVHIPGGADETPIHSTTAEAQPGDSVTVTIANGRATIGGNATSPAATVRSVERVESFAERVEAFAEQVDARVDGVAAQAAQATALAEEAAAVASATNQHFWARSTDPYGDGAGTGAFVTDEEQDTFLAAAAAGFPDTSKPYHNLLMNSLGILLRTAIKNLVSITRSAVAFYDGLGNNASNITALFGADGFQVGSSSESRMVGDYHSLRLVDAEGGTYFHVSDLRNTSGIATITETFVTEALTQTDFTVTLDIYDSSTVTATVNGTYTRCAVSGKTVSLQTAAIWGSEVAITYTTQARNAKAYTLGIDRAGDIGPLSMMEGYANEASGHASHAEGRLNTASGSYAHAEGYESVASGWAAHAEGRSATASGWASSASGNHTTAAGNSQTVVGRYNVEDTQDAFAFIVGNGSSSTPSNALQVRWNGKTEVGALEASGTVTAQDIDASGTLDVGGNVTVGGTIAVTGSVTCGTVNGVDLTQLPLIQRGTVSPAAHAASSTDTSAITFADEFAASPTVIVGIRGQTQTEGIGRCSAWASNVSAMGFTLNFRNDFTSSRTFGAYWVAVGGGTAGGSGGGGDTSALEQRIAELEADMQALAEATAYVGANHISIEGTTVSDALNPITSGTIDGLEI